MVTDTETSFPGRDFIRWTALYLLDTAQGLERAFNDDQLIDLALAVLFICLITENQVAINSALHLEKHWRDMEMERYKVRLKAADAYANKITGRVRLYPFGQVWWGVIAPSRNRYSYTLKRLDETGAVRWKNIPPHQVVEIELNADGLIAYRKVYGNLPWGASQ